MYGHVITKFSGMGRFTYPWCSAGALRAPELRYYHDTDLKNENGSLHLHGGLHVINLNARLCFVLLPRHLTEPYPFLSGKPEMSMDSSTSMRNDTYLLTLQANCATICQMRKHTTPTRPQLTSSDYFCDLAKVFSNQRAPFTKARFQNKSKRPRCIKVSNRPLMPQINYSKDFSKTPQ